MKRLAWMPLLLAGALCACGRPSDTAKAPPASAAPGPLVERASPVRWNAATGAFELAGRALKAVKLWTFDGSTEGFTGVGTKIAPAAGSGIAVRIADPTIRSPKGLNVPGAQFSLVLVRLTRTAPGAAWDGALYYSTATHPEGIGFLGKPMSGADPKLGETTTLVYDMSRQTIGAPDWTQSIIDQIRFDIEDQPGGAFLVRQIAIAENPDVAALGPAPPGVAPVPPPAKAPAPSPKS